ncbi:MAG: HD domain-containing phosphohydrolase [Candidatus Omnitrophota bacterium]
MKRKKADRPTILIVDDEPLASKTLAAILELQEYSVNYTAFGREGLEYLKEGVDLMLLDLKLPDINGIEVLKQAKRKFPDTIVILITAYATVETAVTAMNEGAFTYLTKPFDVEVLFKIIEEALASKQKSSRKERLVSNLSLVYKISKELEGIIELHSIASLASRYLSNAIDADVCAILLMDKKTGEFYFGALDGAEYDKNALSYKRFKLDNRMHKQLVTEHNAILIPQLKSKLPILKYIPVEDPQSLFIFPLVAKDELVGLTLFVSKREVELKEAEMEIISTISSEVAVCIQNANLYLGLKKDYLSAVTALVSSIESKHEYPKRSAMIAEMAAKVARKMDLPEDEVEYIKIAGLLHDIGKMAISEQILFKEEALTIEEFVKLKTHSLISTSIVRSIDADNRLIPIILYHHERYDGGGYPEGLRGEGIPVGARILAVCDAFEAMISKRPYRQSRSTPESMQELKRCAGAQFDPNIVDIFLDLFDEENS